MWWKIQWKDIPFSVVPFRLLVQKLNYVDLLPAQLDAAAALALNTIVPTAQQEQRQRNKSTEMREEESCWKMRFCEM